MDNFLTRKLRVLGASKNGKHFWGPLGSWVMAKWKKRELGKEMERDDLQKRFSLSKGAISRFHVRCFSVVKWQATPEEVNCKGLPGCRTVPFVFSEDFVQSDG